MHPKEFVITGLKLFFILLLVTIYYSNVSNPIEIGRFCANQLGKTEAYDSNYILLYGIEGNSCCSYGLVNNRIEKVCQKK